MSGSSLDIISALYLPKGLRTLGDDKLYNNNYHGYMNHT